MPPRNKIRDNRGRIWYTCRSKLSESAINDRSLKRVISVFNSVSYRAKRLKFMFDLIRKDRVCVRVQVKPVQCWFILWSCFFSNWKIVWSHYNRKWYSRHLKRPRETCCVFSVSCVIEVRKISFFLNLIQFEVTRGPSRAGVKRWSADLRTCWFGEGKTLIRNCWLVMLIWGL